MYRKNTTKPGRLKSYAHKIWLIMRLTTVILIATLMQVSAAGFAQKISLSKKNATLQQVITELRKQSGYDFIATGSVLDQAKPVTINLKNEDFAEALEKIFDEQPIEYSIENKTVRLKIKESSFFEDLVARFQTIDIRAKVTDEKGMPLPGASVRVKNTNQVGMTDAQGVFTLNGVPEDAILVISFIGYNQKEVKASADMGAIILEVATSKLDEVQVMAYGITSRRLSTSNIISVKAEDIEKQPVTNPLLALQGRVPGLDINQSTGYANTGVTVRIQGQNSLTKGSDPLYVIDGVPYPSQMLRGASSILGSSGAVIGRDNLASGDSNPLSFINPGSIESIEVLKDADATAIYGSRAAAGAILITTKRGKSGETKIDANLQSGGGKVSRKLQLLNTEQYLAMRKEAFKNNGVAVPSSVSPPGVNNYDLTVWDQARYTDWQEEFLGGTARYTDAQATVSGGSTNTQYLVGAGYHRETTVFPANFGNSKGSVNFSLNNLSANQRFRIQITGSFMNDNNDVPNHNLAIDALRLSPNAPALYNNDGSLNWAPLPNGTSTWRNPMAYLEQTYSVETNNLLGSASLSYQLLPGLDLKSSFGYTNLTTSELIGEPLSYFAPELRSSNVNSSGFTNSNVNSWTIEPQLTYRRLLGNGTLDALFGATLQQNRTSLLQTSGGGFSSDLLLYDLQSSTINNPGYSPFTRYKYNAVFSRVGYNLLNKYLINLTARRDGSSRFGPKSQFHNFWSLAGAWIFSTEKLFKDHSTFLSFGKLRASYGTTGNDQIGDYQFLNQYISFSVPVAYQGISSLLPAGIPTPELAWEETRKLQAGIDLGFFNDRILFNANYYRNRSSNQLLSYTLPLTTGFSSIPMMNFPATVQNYGWEFMLNTTNIKQENFSWSTSVNLTVPKNKLLKFDKLESSSFANGLVIGEPITISRRYKYLGVDPASGLYKTGDKDGNPTSAPNPATDLTEIVNLSPKLTVGIQNSFIYKGFQFDFLFQFAKRMGYSYRGDRPGIFISSGNSSLNGGNQPVSVLSRWQNPGDINVAYQKFSTYTQPRGTSGLATFSAWNLAQSSTPLGYEDASYIRLKNVAFSWGLPASLLKSIHLSSLRIFTQGQNLLTFTKYNGLDPEAPSNVPTLPSLRVLTFGMKVGL